MPKIYLRTQQEFRKKNDKNVRIYAPVWVEEALRQISDSIGDHEYTFDIYDNKDKKVGSLKIKNPLSLKDLISISRNERMNVTGLINYTLYPNEQEGFSQELIHSLKDLVKHCVIVGEDTTTHYGGFNSKRVKQKKPVYICDLPGLQFQRSYNTGRLVLIGEGIENGLLDDYIYEQTVGEKKKTLAEIDENNLDEQRYIKVTRPGVEGQFFFDKKAYAKFVKQDFILTVLALNQSTANKNTKLNLKFLKYGSGAFLFGHYFYQHLHENLMKDIIESCILEGIKEGLAELHANNNLGKIKRLELPFYTENDDFIGYCKSIDLSCVFNNDDALKAPTEYGMVNAVTNCSDPHAPTGNEMHHVSVDASIGLNLKNKGNNFSPILNDAMSCEYLNTAQILPQAAQQVITKEQVLQHAVKILKLVAWYLGININKSLERKSSNGWSCLVDELMLEVFRIYDDYTRALNTGKQVDHQNYLNQFRIAAQHTALKIRNQNQLLGSRNSSIARALYELSENDQLPTKDKLYLKFNPSANIPEKVKEYVNAPLQDSECFIKNLYTKVAQSIVNVYISKTNNSTNKNKFAKAQLLGSEIAKLESIKDKPALGGNMVQSAASDTQESQKTIHDQVSDCIKRCFDTNDEKQKMYSQKRFGIMRRRLSLFLSKTNSEPHKLKQSVKREELTTDNSTIEDKQKKQPNTNKILLSM